MPFFCIFFDTPTGMPSTKQGDTDLHLEADKRHQQQSTQALAEATPSQSECEENQDTVMKMLMLLVMLILYNDVIKMLMLMM